MSEGVDINEKHFFVLQSRGRGLAERRESMKKVYLDFTEK